jgi:Ca2+-binding EF-hand superfamily protein
MRTNQMFKIACVFVVSLLGTCPAQGQPPEGPPPSEGPPRMMHPLIAALDADEDGVIAAEEIESAAKSLKTLDKNEDGKITRDELRPAWAPERGFRGGPLGFGPGPGPGAGRGPGAGPDERPGREFGRDPARRVERMMQFDENNDGKLTEDEVPEQFQEVMQRVDEDGDGSVTPDELKQIAESRQRPEGAERRQGGAAKGRRFGELPEGGPRRPQRPDGRGGPPRDFPGPDVPPGARRSGGQGRFQTRFIDRLFEFDRDQDGKLSREELESMQEAPER